LVPLVLSEGRGDDLPDADGIEEVELVAVQTDALTKLALPEPVPGGEGQFGAHVSPPSP